MDINAIYKEKRKLFGEFEDMRKNLAKETRAATAEETEKLNKYMTDIEELDIDIKMEKRALAIEANKAEPVKPKANEPSADEMQEKRDGAFKKWVQKGHTGMTPEERALIGISPDNKQSGFSLGTPSQVEKRATAGVTNPTYFQEVDLGKILYETKIHFGGWMDAATEFTTATGRAFYWPTIDDASNTGALEAAGTDAFDGATTLTYGRTLLNAYFYSSEGLAIDDDDLADMDLPFSEAIFRPLATRYWRAVATALTTGTGSSQPDGIVTNAGVGEIATKDVTPTYTDITNLVQKVDYAYHNMPKSGFMMHANTMYKTAALGVGSSDTTLWLPSMRDNMPSTILGFKYWINNAMDQIGTNKKPIIFGDMGTHLIRHVGSPQMIRLDERYKEKLQTGFIVVGRVDSDTLDAGTAIKYIRNLGT